MRNAKLTTVWSAEMNLYNKTNVIKKQQLISEIWSKYIAIISIFQNVIINLTDNLILDLMKIFPTASQNL